MNKGWVGFFLVGGGGYTDSSGYGAGSSAFTYVTYYAPEDLTRIYIFIGRGGRVSKCSQGFVYQIFSTLIVPSHFHFFEGSNGPTQ